MAQGNFGACLPTILQNEGGFSIVRSDPGNWTGGRVGVGELKGTNMGIAASAHPDLDIAKLTRPQVEAIYDRDYWTPSGCEELPTGLDLSHFDGTVNSGRRNSGRWLGAARNGDTPARIHGYARARLHSLESWRIWARFGRGLAARVARVEAKSLDMALGEAAPAEIAAASARAVTKARVGTIAAHASTSVATATTTTGVMTNHYYLGTAVGLAFAASAVWQAFHSAMSSARSTALASHSVELPRTKPSMNDTLHRVPDLMSTG